MIIGSLVKLNQSIKEKYISNGCQDHIQEFGDCIGLVVGYMFPDTEEFVDVRWQPSNLRYGYAISDLVEVDSE